MIYVILYIYKLFRFFLSIYVFDSTLDNNHIKMHGMLDQLLLDSRRTGLGLLSLVVVVFYLRCT